MSITAEALRELHRIHTQLGDLRERLARGPKQVLAREELRQLRQRILVHYELHPLSLHDVQHYVQHRLILAGSMGRPHFTNRALKSIHRASKGIPRIVNNLCDKSLLAAFIRESDEVNYWDVRRAVNDMAELTA